ncbi:MAG: tetratricopeptide repeat protein, partial [Planctomycetota bacterium]|jgi:tetratricopeptide (TPR) repeat protein
MKMVRGQPLSQVLRAIKHGDEDTAKRHSLDRMLQIMLKVCDAVSFAAARGVVHRDLKPENIMLGRFGEVVVMDWGLARVQGKDAHEDHKTSIFTDHSLRKSSDSESTPSSAFSMEGSIAGTPAYMAPEQAKGEISRINESTDVFALGAILCEVLCLHGPYLGKGRKDVLEEAADGDVTTPLERVDIDSGLKEKLTHLPNNRIPPELDAIAAKAMQTKQRHRYESVRAFKEDLENFIAGRPVTVRKDSLTVQVSKWVRRHPTLSVSTAAAAAVILLATAVIGFVIAEDKRQDAEQAKELADAQKHLAESSKNAADASDREAKAQREAAEASKVAADASKKAAEDAEKLATVRERIANTERELKKAAEKRASELQKRTKAEVAFHKGAALADRVVNFADADLRKAASIKAEAALKVAILSDPTYVDPVYKLARLLDFTGDRRALDYYEKTSDLMKGDPRSLLYAGEFARLRLGKISTAKSYYTESSELSKSNPLSIVAHGYVAWLENDPRRAMDYARRAQDGDVNLWEPWFLSGHIRGTETLDNGERNTEFNPRLAARHFGEARKRSVRDGAISHARGLALLKSGQLDEAIEDLKKAKDIHPDWLKLQVDLAEGYLSRGRTEDAMRLMREHQQMRRHEENADVAYIIGAVEHQKGNYDKARELLDRAMKLDRDHLRAKNRLTKTLLRLKLFERAARYAKFAVKEHPSSPAAIAAYAEALIYNGKKEEANKQINAALSLRRGWPIGLAVKANLRLVESEYREAIRLATQAVNTEGQWEFAHGIFAVICMETAEHEQAETHLNRALEINPTSVLSRYNLCLLLRHLQRHSESIEHAKKIVDNSSVGSKTKFEMGWNFIGLGDNEKAREWFVKAGESQEGYGDAWINAALCANLTNQFELGREYAYKAAKASPFHVLSWVQVCKSEIELNNLEKANEAVDSALDCYWTYPVEWADVASMLVALNRHLEAIDCCNQITDRFPSFTRAWIINGAANESLTRYSLAMKAYQAAAESAPNEPEPHIQIASLHWTEKRYADCVRSAKKVLELDPQSHVGHYLIGTAWGALGEDRTSAEHLESAVRLSPTYLDARTDLIIVQIRLGEYHKCIHHGDILTTLYPINAKAWRLLGLGHYFLEQWEDAADAFIQANSIESGDFGAHANLAYSLQQLGRHTEALKQAKEAVAVDKSLLRGHLLVAISEFELKHWQEAGTAYDNCAKMDPLNIYWPYNAALAWASHSDFKKAEAAAKLATERKDFFNESFVALAWAQVGLKKTDDALKSLRSALKHGVPKDRIFDNDWFRDLHHTDGWKTLKKDFPTD